MKIKSAIYPALLTGLLILLLFGCKKSIVKEEVVKNLPTIKVSTLTNTTASTSTIITEISSDGGDSISARGVCWGTSHTPTITDQKTTDGKGIGSFTSSISGLIPSATYYYRAYATNSVGTVYGTELSSTTLASTPVLTMSGITDITLSSVKCNVNITSDRGASVTSRGVCWSTSPDPTIADHKTIDGSGTGSFTSSITGLSPNLNYYVRAYATNSIGTSYSSASSFLTLKSPPELTTISVSAITATSAISGGIITSDGGVTITAVGVCWSTTQNPTIANSKTRDDISNAFFSYLTALMPNTTYYVRAYATNSLGTTYGAQISFLTLPSVPEITTAPLFLLTSTSANCGGIISKDGGVAVTARGVCWSKSQNPTIADTKTINGTGIGSFTSNITGLDVNTTYYLRAYATNSAGTAYSNQVSFITSP
ncbi:MAG: hypothetical protein NTY07_13725 [Bacteroidia bacterium]|nr:hypothetical protein [Bacteroidia bacterium]